MEDQKDPKIIDLDDADRAAPREIFSEIEISGLGQPAVRHDPSLRVPSQKPLAVLAVVPRPCFPSDVVGQAGTVDFPSWTSPHE